jgi:hypothetical protein
MHVKGVALVLAGFAAGVLACNLPSAIASSPSGVSNLSQKHFRVSIDEIQQNFVFFDEFTGHYTKTVTLSDGTTRNIELTPMVHDGKQVVEFKDTGGLTYMSLNGTTTNGKLMVQVRDVEASRAQLGAKGSPSVGR